MKSLKFILWVLLAAVSLGRVEAGEGGPENVALPIVRMYAVDGYDDNDRVQLTVEGTLPNTCFKVAKSVAQIDEAAKTLWLNSEAYHYKANCLRIPVNYTDVIHVGIVPQGDYKIVDKLTGKNLGSLSVKKANRPEADDHLYALLEDVYVHFDAKTNWLVLKGKLTDSCSELVEIKVNYTQNAIIVQPIVERVGTHCEPGEYAFTKQQPLPSSLNGNFLLHARSMSGQAVNKVVGLNEP